MKRKKKRRLSPGAQFRPPGENLRPTKSRVLAADRRQIEREQAEETFPVLAEKLAAIRLDLLKNLAKGRYGYRDSLLEIYELAWKWAGEDRFAQRDLPPLKWSSLKYDFRMEDEIDGKEEAYG